jgi:hypothetical protein
MSPTRKLPETKEVQHVTSQKGFRHKSTLDKNTSLHKKSLPTEEYVPMQEVLHRKRHDTSSMPAKLFSFKLHDKSTKTGSLHSSVLVT